MAIWCTDLKNGKYQYVMDYIDPLTEKRKYVSVDMKTKSKKSENQASKILSERIEKKILKADIETNIKYIDLLNDWWEFYKKGIKQSSISSLQSSVNKMKSLFDEDTIISRITTKNIQTRLLNLDTSHGTKERMKSMLNLLFDYAVNNNLLKTNPARSVKLPRRQKTLKEYESITNKYLEQHELNLLLKELYRTKLTYRHGLLAEFMSLNGCRIGEAIALKIENYHKDEKTIDIHGTLDKTVGYRKGSKTTPKTVASYRTVDLSDREVEILDEIIELNEVTKILNPKYEDMDFIFVSRNGIPLANNSFNLALKRANLRIEEPINKELSSHIFRHTHISYLAENGIPLEAIKERVGHSDGSKTTEKIYTHVTKKMKKSIINILNKFRN